MNINPYRRYRPDTFSGKRGPTPSYFAAREGSPWKKRAQKRRAAKENKRGVRQ